MEILHAAARNPVRAVLFDFDGTISTLRCGWESVMKPLMLEMISGGAWDDALEREVDDYINESAGIQTIHQMKWLAEAVRNHGRNPGAPTDPWQYKAEYNRRLMQTVDARLSALTGRGVKLYVASGTDHPDVLREAGALGLTQYFAQIAGAPVGSESCSKEKVIAQLMEQESLQGALFAVIGDGRVEIRLGREAGARTLGLASDEAARRGVTPVKRGRLLSAGADAICGDFTELDAILEFRGL